MFWTSIFIFNKNHIWPVRLSFIFICIMSLELFFPPFSPSSLCPSLSLLSLLSSFLSSFFLFVIIQVIHTCGWKLTISQGSQNSKNLHNSSFPITLICFFPKPSAFSPLALSYRIQLQISKCQLILVLSWFFSFRHCLLTSPCRRWGFLFLLPLTPPPTYTHSHTLPNPPSSPYNYVKIWITI